MLWLWAGPELSMWPEISNQTHPLQELERWDVKLLIGQCSLCPCFLSSRPLYVQGTGRAQVFPHSELSMTMSEQSRPIICIPLSLHRIFKLNTAVKGMTLWTLAQTIINSGFKMRWTLIPTVWTKAGVVALRTLAHTCTDKRTNTTPSLSYRCSAGASSSRCGTNGSRWGSGKTKGDIEASFSYAYPLCYHWHKPWLFLRFKWLEQKALAGS